MTEHKPKFQKLLDNDVVTEFARWLAMPKSVRRQMTENDPDFPQTQKEFSVIHSISEQTVCSWKKDKRVQKMKSKFQKEYASDNMSEVVKTLTDRAIEGDSTMVKLYLQYVGELVEKQQISMTNEKVDDLIGKIVSIIQKYVTDVEILNKIAKDIGELEDDE